MCGIAGHIGREAPSHEAIERTLDCMRYRGPDASGFSQHGLASTQLTLLHSRLSIIDLDERANQPFQRGPCTLVFNGEIYNYLELKVELEGRGHEFTTSSDTEVLLACYLEYGTACVEKFEGMWAFALYDERDQALFLSRDRFGEKPLYFFKDEQGLFFGSEIKALSALSSSRFEINSEHLLRYLVHGYKSLYKTDDTFFRGVERLPPRTNLFVASDGAMRFERYWNPRFEPQDISEAEAVETVRERLLNSMKLRLRSDVPLAFCLSGGVDSGALVSIASKEFSSEVHSFSIIDEDERYNEAPNIQATVRDTGCKNTSIVLQPSTSFDRLRDLIRYHDAPISTISYYIHSFLSEQISSNGYKVAFSGTAADEMFTGYYDHFILHLHEMKGLPRYGERRSEWEEHVKGFVRNPHLSDPQLYDRDPSFRDHVYLNRDAFCDFLVGDFSEQFVEQHYTDSSLLRNRMLNEMFHEVTPVILHEDDLNSMRYSVENRSPYLDMKLFEFLFTVPSELLIKNGYGKYLLREATAGILNDVVRLDRHKKGYNAAIDSVFDFSSPEVRDVLFSDGPLYDYVRRDKVEELLNRDTLPNSFSKFLFNIVNCKLFLEIFS